MKNGLRILSVSVLGLGLMVSTAGCEQCEIPADDGDTEETRAGFCSVNKFVGSKRNEAQSWESGGKVSIEGRNGQIRVIRGNATAVSATFEPFVFRAHNVDEDAVRKNFEEIETTVTKAGGDILVKTSRQSGAPSSLGADIVVELPPAFDGDLSIVQRNGSVTVRFVGDAALLDIRSDNGSIEASTADVPVVSLAGKNGSVTAEVGRADALDMRTDRGDVKVDISEVAADAAGGTIETGRGDVSLTVPQSGAFSVLATALEAVDFGSLPATCEEQVAAVNSKTLTCNEGGGQFEVNADGTGSQVTVSYR